MPTCMQGRSRAYIVIIIINYVFFSHMTELWFNFVCIINRSVTLDFMPTACSWHKKMLVRVLKPTLFNLTIFNMQSNKKYQF